ncbi:unnamed protein product [Phaeothamnion confervicola]
MLGPKLINAQGEEVETAGVTKSKVVALYFSAHWCGPCRGFTPVLAALYQRLRDRGESFEVVFVSSDKSEEQFRDYFATMPWMALPFADRARKAKLSSKYKVRGIPMLVLLDADGRTITTDGRAVVMSDQDGVDFPWKPRSVHEVLGDSFVDSTGNYVGSEAIIGKTLALLFSASWCPPCKLFTPKLIQTYAAMRGASGRDDFEFVFVSSDRDEASFEGYRSKMPWLSLPFQRRDAQAELSRMFGVRGIPTLVTLRPDGTIVNTAARSPAEADTTGAAFPWAPQPLADLSFGTECMGNDINDKPSLVVLMEGADDIEQKEIVSAMGPPAKAAVAAAAEEGGGDQEMLFFMARSSAGVVPQIRRLLGLPPNSVKPVMVLIDIANNGAFYQYQGEDITTDTISAFVADFKAGKLPRQQLG